MSFTATIISITPVVDSTGIGLTYSVVVRFLDDATTFTSDKTYSFPLGASQSSAVNQITKDGTALKNNLASIGTLSSKVGSVITI